MYRKTFRRRTVPATGPTVLTRRCIYILPTRHGLMFALMLFVMLLGSMNYNNSMGFLLTFLLAGMALVSILHTYHNLSGLRAEAGKAVPAFAGESCLFQLWLDNRGRRARYSCQLYRSQKGAARGNRLFADIPRDQRTCVEIPVSAQQRGRLSLGRVTLQSCFPLGLFRAWAYLEFDVHSVVYPRPAGQQTLPPGKPKTGKKGTRHSLEGEDFIGHRDCHPGDSLRHVDWKAAARGQGKLIKQFGGGESNAAIWLSWEDVSRYRHVEAGLSQLCRWVLAADSQNLSYGLNIPGSRLPPGHGAEHRRRCLEALALFG
ncbi:MAG: DUF58 domain-containing protein [Gammaproteobacteria bacterium]|nr:DUF58 domain-containing protein [Gammaproteobacteria bacterium]